MIKRVQALNYRSFKYLDLSINNFNVLVGPNASGKTTFLDILAFVTDVIKDGPINAIEKRTPNFYDLLWQGEGNSFELAIECEIPESVKSKLSNKKYVTIRYEIKIGVENNTQEAGILSERVQVLPEISVENVPKTIELFPSEPDYPASLTNSSPKGSRSIITKGEKGNDNFYSEINKKAGKGWAPSIKLGSNKSALGNIPAAPELFPVSTWFKDLLSEGIQQLILNSQVMRKPSPPVQGNKFKPDGSNLPWVIKNLKENSPENFSSWLAHIKTALPDITDIKTVERPEDKHCYLKIKYNTGNEVPSWSLSDGTLRLLALTLPAYLHKLSGIFLIEEPENGIHPSAVETVHQSLSSMYKTQILIATHSPVFLNLTGLSQLLCFAKTKSGFVDIVRGDEHPNLKNWKEETPIGTLFAGGVLG